MSGHDFRGRLDGAVGRKSSGHGQKRNGGGVVLQGKDGIRVLLGHFVKLGCLDNKIAKIGVDRWRARQKGQETQDADGDQNRHRHLEGERPFFGSPHRPLVHFCFGAWEKMISLEGNVGVGKSTVLRELERRGLRVCFEAVDHWTLLEPFYRDPARFGFGFQLQVLASYAATPEQTQIVERSSQAALSVFVPLAARNGNLTAEQVDQLHAVRNFLPLPPIQKFVFLVASPDLCLRRVAWRNRDGEDRITLDYLRQLDVEYQRFMNEIPDNQKLIIHIQEVDSPAIIADQIIEQLGL